MLMKYVYVVHDSGSELEVFKFKKDAIEYVQSKGFKKNKYFWILAGEPRYSISEFDISIEKRELR